MARPKETSNKKELQKKKEKKRQEKEKKKLDRKENNNKGASLESMFAYVDEFGNITSTPPDLTQRTKVDAESINVSVPRNTNREEVDKVRKGILSFFNDSKGFGFIKDSSSQESIFVHINDLLEPVKENNAVLFEVERGLKGLKAVNVKVDR